MFHWLKNLFILLIILGILGFIVLVGTFIMVLKDVPDPNTIISRRVSESTKIFDREEEVILYDIHGEEKRTIIPWEDISDNIKDATVTIEDANFYQHRGLDFRGITRAFFKNIKNLKISQGGSTITQQLVKNALLTNERTVTRKLKELVLTLEIERKFTKDEILWMYLNQIPYGSNSYGIQAASQTFFSVDASELTTAQATILASLPRASTFYSPYGNNVDALFNRQKLVLSKMESLGYIDEEEYNEALEEEIEFERITQSIQAPHFVIMVREYLISRYGEEMIENGGLKVITTLDNKLQVLADELVPKHAELNEERFSATNTAITAIDPKSGQILALVGSRDYFDIENDGNFNVATALRQPGSSFKPFAYATVIDNGFTDSTIVFDLKTEFNPECDFKATEEEDKYGLKCYHPKNYDDQFRGPVTLRQGLAQSLNVPSVKTLHLAGIDNTINLATDMGITSLGDKDRFGLSLVLGGAEVRLLELTSAYGVFANDGIRNPSTFILKIEDSEGNILEEWKQKEERVIDPQVARMITDMLSDNLARTAVFGPNSYLQISGRSIAAKTGTTQDSRDGWLVGYTPSLAVGVWTGNNDNSEMTGNASGSSVAGPLWNEFMRSAIADTENEIFIRPNPLITEKIMLNGDYGSLSEAHTILFHVDKNNPTGSAPNNPSSESQFQNWEDSVRNTYNPYTPTPTPEILE